MLIAGYLISIGFVLSRNAVYFKHTYTNKFLGIEDHGNRDSNTKYIKPILTDKYELQGFYLKNFNGKDKSMHHIVDIHSNYSFAIKDNNLVLKKTKDDKIPFFKLILNEDETHSIEYENKCLVYERKSDIFTLGSCKYLEDSKFVLYKDSHVVNKEQSPEPKVHIHNHYYNKPKSEPTYSILLKEDKIVEGSGSKMHGKDIKIHHHVTNFDDSLRYNKIIKVDSDEKDAYLEENRKSNRINGSSLHHIHGSRITDSESSSTSDYARFGSSRSPVHCKDIFNDTLI